MYQLGSAGAFALASAMQWWFGQQHRSCSKAFMHTARMDCMHRLHASLLLRPPVHAQLCACRYLGRLQLRRLRPVKHVSWWLGPCLTFRHGIPAAWDPCYNNSLLSSRQLCSSWLEQPANSILWSSDADSV